MQRKPRDPFSGLKRSLANARRMHGLGKRYRKEVPDQEKSYQRWLEFLAKHAPRMLGLSDPEKVAARYDASPKPYASN